MIVKNEQNVLARCLDSMADLMDEIIIVDTGSQDATKEIAAKYTDKIYDFAWIDDFAAARNFAASKAQIEIVQMYYCNDMGECNTTGNFERELRPKLYRRLRSFTWIDPIHETLRLDPVVFDSEIEIIHKPEHNHGGRDLTALKRLHDKGITLSAKLHHMYAMELFIAGSEQDFLDAEASFLESIEQNGRTDDEILEAVCVLTHIYRLKKDVAHFFAYALRGVAMGGCAELCCELGTYYEEQGEPAEAAMWYFNAANETESILDIACHTRLPQEALERITGKK